LTQDIKDLLYIFLKDIKDLIRHRNQCANFIVKLGASSTSLKGCCQLDVVCICIEVGYIHV